MLRIHFENGDLARIRFVKKPDPLWELVLSRHVLQRNDGQLVFGSWRRRVRRCLRDGTVVGAIKMLGAINPAGPYFPDFLTPEPLDQGIEPAIDTVLTTPQRRLCRDLLMLARYQTLSAWTRRLADGDPGILARLGTGLRVYYNAIIAPEEECIRREIDADRASRARAFLNGGAEGLLNSFRPLLRWEAPVLWANYPAEHDLHLNGRGLVLVPSYFCWRYPVTLEDTLLPPVLVYPVARSMDNERSGARPIAKLLGYRRYVVLEKIGGGATTTTELARLARLSVSSASEHATVLREAGLISSQRDANTMLHTLTPLGERLLAGG